MEKVSAVISNPFEGSYNTSTGELTLSSVESTGRMVEVRFDPYATRALCELMISAAKQNKGLIGLSTGDASMH